MISFTDRTITSTGEDGNTVRRRTEAYAWDRELYREWNGGSACWLDPDRGKKSNDDRDNGDDDPFAALQHVSCTFPADAANENGGSDAPGSCNSMIIHNNFVQGSGDLLQPGNYGASLTAEPEGTYTLHNPENAAIKNRKAKKCTGSEKEKYPTPGSDETHAANVKELPENCSKETPAPQHPGKRLQETRYPGAFDQVFYLREEGCVVRGEVYQGTAGERERPAGCPVAAPVVPCGSGEGRAGSERLPAGDIRSFRDEAGDRGSREVSGVRGGKS